jgi:hypothetical protein
MFRHAELHVQHVEGSTTPETDEPIVELGSVPFAQSHHDSTRRHLNVVIDPIQSSRYNPFVHA